MPAPSGNKNGVKLKDPKIRQEAYRQYCAHIATGYPKEAFVFDHPTATVIWETLDKYIKDDPVEFNPVLMKAARSKRFKYWIDEGKKVLDGTYNRGSPVVWQTIMRNIFRDIGWDQDKVNEALEDHRAQFKDFMKLLSDKQKEVNTYSSPSLISSS